ncbi:rRNA N6-adenosine-methyltransferase ZCCHC4 [Polypterus senegalus]|uniref:rRNA N6-adenosine-methyltransferase ZCCHC4 n=1 Tax=Polypterus senegalus TaxID=55291 RepID=UPI001966BD7A|nr:rRNA N6-adenosine-methyltransferase ZCCHC4 [Polypterus senegalus]
MSEEDDEGLQVILNEEVEAKAPSCPHGPTLLFVKYNKKEGAHRRFYACSACRDRKDCNFFQWEDEKVSELRLLAREQNNKRKQPPFSHTEYYTRYRHFISLPLIHRRFCQDCQLLLLPGDWDEHSSHSVLCDISVGQLRRPSQLLHPLENKKTNAQYLFAERSCMFLLDLFESLGLNKILCVGTPRLHELIKIRNSEGHHQVMKSLLMDIDFRYCQFNSEDEFCHYNMFNNYFFDAEQGYITCRKFLLEVIGEQVVLVSDPPFGGLVKPLAHSFNKISTIWKAQQQPESSVQEMPIFWIFPYFFESRIKECFPTFSMLDYQVDYENHALYKHGKKGRRQSPVRIFTNLSPRDIILPSDEGYRFCSQCQRYVSSENKHCDICDACPSKDGRQWKHCLQCNKCVKPTWVHCLSCNRCALKDHCCSKPSSGCFICGDEEHKRSICPRKYSSENFKQQKAKQKNGSPRKKKKMSNQTVLMRATTQTVKKKKRKEARLKKKMTV